MQIKEVTAREPEGAPQEAGASMEFGDPATSTRDPPTVSEHGGRLDCGDDAASSVEPQTVKETEKKTLRIDSPQTVPGMVETGAEGVSSDISGSPADPTTFEASLSAIERVSEISSQSGGEPASTTECKTENNEKEEEEVEMDGLKEIPVINAVGEDINMEPPSSSLKAMNACDTDEQMDTGMEVEIETKEGKEGDDDSKNDLNETPVIAAVYDEAKDEDQSGTSQDTTADNLEPLSCKPMVIATSDLDRNEDKIAVMGGDATKVGPSSRSLVSTSANDLDEMMDMGTVDQVEQEAQMKDEEERKIVEMDSSNSPMPSIVNTGKNAISF